jgi:radical SAM superfamily enzyme YgiQ (UPF0313 family)
MKSSMKVMFVYHNRVEEGFMPYSIAVLGGMMKTNGIESKLFDTTFYRDKNSPITQTDREIRESQKKGGYKKVDGFGHPREVVDLRDKFREEVELYKPDLIAATSTSFEFDSMTDFILPTKERLNIPVIFGGSHATVVPEEAILNPAVDYVCVGEGERPLLNLVRRLEMGEDTSEIPNILSKGQAKIHSRYPILHMDETPDADWDLINGIHRKRPFEGDLKEYGFFEMSRGCPRKCSYCINSKLHEMESPGGIKPGQYRFFSSEEAISRIVRKKERYGFDHIHFIDENLAALPQSRLEEVAGLFREKVGVGFFTQSRPEQFIRKSRKAKIIAEMGCKMVAMGMESGNEWLRKNVLNRPMKDGVIEEAAESLREAGIKIAGYYIIGFPEETREMIRETIELHKRVRPDRFSVRFLHPFPGTKIREYCVKKGYLDRDFESRNRDASFFKDPVLNLPSPPHPPREELIELMEEFKNY